MYCNPTMFDGMADRLFRNNGDGTFTDVSKAAGIANPAGKGLGVTFCDLRPRRRHRHLRRQRHRSATSSTATTATARSPTSPTARASGFDRNGKPQAGMGVDCADVDGNGLPDIFVTNFSEELNTLYKNPGGGIFEDVTTAAGLGPAFEPLGFGTKLFDIDNDGDLDIHVTNGHVIDNVQLYQPTLTYAQKDLLYENLGRTFPRRHRPGRAGAPGSRASAAGWRSPTSTTTATSTSSSPASASAPVLLRNQSVTARQLARRSGRRARRATVRTRRDGDGHNRGRRAGRRRSTTSRAT